MNTRPDATIADDGTLSRSRQGIASELGRLIEQAESLLGQLGEEGGAAMSDLRNRVSHTMSEARERLSQSSARARHMASSAAHSADDYVRSNPWQAVTLGVLIGAVATALLTRMPSNRHDA